MYMLGDMDLFYLFPNGYSIALTSDIKNPTFARGLEMLPLSCPDSPCVLQSASGLAVLFRQPACLSVHRHRRFLRRGFMFEFECLAGMARLVTLKLVSVLSVFHI